jgi:hypothetical protein
MRAASCGNNVLVKRTSKTKTNRFEVLLMMKVFNLSNDSEMEFSHNDAEQAVCYAYAEEKNLLSLFFSMVQNDMPLNEKFNVVRGSRSISCGNWATLI